MNTSTKIQEKKTSTTKTPKISSSATTSPSSKLRQIAPAPTGKPDYDIYHIPKGYEVFLVSKNETSDNLPNAADSSSNPIPLSPTCSISSASSNCSTSPKIIAP